MARVFGVVWWVTSNADYVMFGALMCPVRSTKLSTTTSSCADSHSHEIETSSYRARRACLPFMLAK